MFPNDNNIGLLVFFINKDNIWVILLQKNTMCFFKSQLIYAIESKVKKVLAKVYNSIRYFCFFFSNRSNKRK